MRLCRLELVVNVLEETCAPLRNGAPRASPCLHAGVPAFAERPHAGSRFGTQAWFPKTVPTYAEATVGHPPISEIRRSMTESLLTKILSGVTHSSTAKAVVSCVGG